MQEHKNIITMRGNPLTLIGNGNLIKVGDKAPDFQAVANDMSIISFLSFQDFKNKICLISSVPSLDTPVCDVQTRRFNAEAKRIAKDNLKIITISMDLPFAQKRWCGAAGVEYITTLSDYNKADFGLSYGLLIKELRLLTRAVILINPSGFVDYVQIVSETSKEPIYSDVIDALEKIK